MSILNELEKFSIDENNKTRNEQMKKQEAERAEQIRQRHLANKMVHYWNELIAPIFGKFNEVLRHNGNSLHWPPGWEEQGNIRIGNDIDISFTFTASEIRLVVTVNQSRIPTLDKKYPVDDIHIGSAQENIMEDFGRAILTN